MFLEFMKKKVLWKGRKILMKEGRGWYRTHLDNWREGEEKKEIFSLLLMILLFQTRGEYITSTGQTFPQY